MIGPAKGRTVARLARRIEACATSFHVRVRTPRGEATEIITRNQRDCRSRLCPISAAWSAATMRRKVQALIDEVFAARPDARALFLTLTLPAQPAVSASLKPLKAALKRFRAIPDVIANTRGIFISIEVTVGGTPDAPTLHIHAHGLVIVDGGPGGYFKGGVPRVHQTTWAQWWQTAARLDRKPVVDIRAARGPSGETDPASVRRSAAELAKYAISPAHFAHDDNGITADPTIVLALHTLLKGQQLVSFDRCFKDAQQRLKTNPRNPS
ncbi:MAG TPA: protein rep [Hyphomicrobiaceae bacterium]|nr:protein rep [Hyphomicrobiaceae bacterium]